MFFMLTLVVARYNTPVLSLTMRTKNLALVYLMGQQSIVSNICQISPFYTIGKLMLISGVDMTADNLQTKSGQKLLAN